jgi:hypothetical protein
MLLAGVPVLFADGARPAVQGGAGLRWLAADSIGVFALAGVAHFFSVPEHTEPTVFLPSLGVQARL